MTKQTWTAAVSALLFVLAAATVALTPVDYVTLSPGASVPLLPGPKGPGVTVEGVPSHADGGQLQISSVQVTDSTAAVSLPEVLHAQLSASRHVMPRDAVHPHGASRSLEDQEHHDQLANATRANAAAAGLRAAGVSVTQVPMVQSVAKAGPADQLVAPGDFVIAVDGTPVATVAAARAAISSRNIGDPVTLTVLRNQERLDVTIATAASKTQSGVPVWGGNLVMGYYHVPRVSYRLEDVSDPPSAGLMVALAVFDTVTPGSLTNGADVAGTGVIDGSGVVSATGGIPEKIASAEAAGATVFLLPSANCRDVGRTPPTLRLVSVSSLEDAINALDALADPATEGLVRGCA